MNVAHLSCYQDFIPGIFFNLVPIHAVLHRQQ